MDKTGQNVRKSAVGIRNNPTFRRVEELLQFSFDDGEEILSHIPTPEKLLSRRVNLPPRLVFDAVFCFSSSCSSGIDAGGALGFGGLVALSLVLGDVVRHDGVDAGLETLDQDGHVHRIHRGSFRHRLQVPGAFDQSVFVARKMLGQMGVDATAKPLANRLRTAFVLHG